ncbi:MAG: hypothetical protein K0Q94_913 [Paenibacillus sp.]|jgi:hypothetical protein|nr:hypothetical protein [Paenibacillus sp.]
MGMGSGTFRYEPVRGNNRVLVFTPDGEFIRMFDNDMDYPCSFYFSGNDGVSGFAQPRHPL